MRSFSNILKICTLSLLTIVFINPASAQLEVHLTAGSDVVLPGGRIVYFLSAGNAGSTNILDGVVRVKLPENIFTFGEQLEEGLDCPSSGCHAEETATWTIGTLEPGETRFLIYSTSVSTSAPDQDLVSTVTASASGASDQVFTQTVQIRSGLSGRVSLNAEAGAVAAGDSITYTIVYSNAGTGSMPAPVLQFEIPQQTSFVAATHGGSESNGIVTWMPGSVIAGSGDQVRLTLAVDGGVSGGTLLAGRVSLDSGLSGEPVILAESVIPVQNDSGLRIENAVSQSVIGASSRIVYTLTASNKGSSELLDVEVKMLLPSFINTFGEQLEEGLDCPSSGCHANEYAVWDVGALAPGESRVLMYHTFSTFSVDPGELLRTELLTRATGAGHRIEGHTVLVDDSPPVRLSVATGLEESAPGEEITYTISFSNIALFSFPAPVLRLAMPAGASLISATDGGVANGRFIEWNPGALIAGEGGRVQAVVALDEALVAGDLLKAEAVFESDVSAEADVYAQVVTAANARQSLQVSLTGSQTALGADDRITYQLLVTNAGNTELLDVEVDILLPENLDTFGEQLAQGFDCPSSGCHVNERALWNVGTLAPGESRRLIYQSFLSFNVPAGEMIRSVVKARSITTGQIISEHIVHVDPEPQVRLSVTPELNHMIPGQPFTYIVSFGNIGDTGVLSSAEIHLDLPEGTTFVSADEEGSASDGRISWNVGPLEAGTGGRLKAVVQVSKNAVQGELLAAEATMITGASNQVVVRSQVATPVDEEHDLEVTLTASQSILGPADRVRYRLTAANKGQQELLDVVVKAILPELINTFSEQLDEGLDCPSSGCHANEEAVWTVGRLAPGESRTLFYNMFVQSGAPAGDLLRTVLLANSATTSQITTSHDLIIDETPLVRMHLAHDAGPVVPGDTVRYTVTYGDLDASNSIQSPALHFKLPEGLTFASASEGGTESGGLVTWNLPPLQAESGGQVYLKTVADPALSSGQVLEAEAVFDTGKSRWGLIRSQAATPVKQPGELEVSFMPDVDNLVQNDNVTYQLRVTNSGVSEMLDVNVWLMLPEFINTFNEADAGIECPSSGCHSNETGLWAVGTLAPGQSLSRTITMTPSFSASRGELMNTTVYAQANGIDRFALFSDLVVTENLVRVSEESEIEIREFSVQNYPSPFSQETTFELVIPEPGPVRLVVYDLLGREQRVLIDEYSAGGKFQVVMDASTLPAGLYFYRLTASEAVYSGSMVKAN